VEKGVSEKIPREVFSEFAFSFGREKGKRTGQSARFLQNSDTFSAKVRMISSPGAGTEPAYLHVYLPARSRLIGLDGACCDVQDGRLREPLLAVDSRRRRWRPVRYAYVTAAFASPELLRDVQFLESLRIEIAGAVMYS